MSVSTSHIVAFLSFITTAFMGCASSSVPPKPETAAHIQVESKHSDHRATPPAKEKHAFIANERRSNPIKEVKSTARPKSEVAAVQISSPTEGQRQAAATSEPKVPTAAPSSLQSIPEKSSEATNSVEKTTPAALPTAAATESPATPTALPSPMVTLNAKHSDKISVTGSMVIDFRSRVFPEEDDVYKLDLVVAESLNIRGRIIRHQRKVSSILGREQQPLQFEYDLRLSTLNPENKSETKETAKWRGLLNLGKDGKYTPQNLSLLSRNGATSELFTGIIHGKADEKPGFLGAVREYTRLLGKKKVTVSVQRSDPLRFDKLTLAAGPLPAHSNAIVSGNLDYDYDTGNWLTSGITFEGQNFHDKITGSIKWIEDPNRESNGKGSYSFNLRFNEAAQTETTFFEGASDEEAFFAVDSSVPTLSGNIYYKDTFGGESSGEPQVIRSEVRYALEGNKIDVRQLVTFVKLWLLISGPVNDE